jgi:hypothetical protein
MQYAICMQVALGNAATADKRLGAGCCARLSSAKRPTNSIDSIGQWCGANQYT